jgi:putative metallohydrolase (TIGR04338 family)
MTRPRDMQRRRVYRAERVLPDEWTNVFGTTAATQQWVNGLLARRWFRNRWPGLTGLQVLPGRGGTATSLFGAIRIPPDGRNVPTVLHEVAHEIVARRPVAVRAGPDAVARPPGASHGPEFCSVMLFLVRQVMGARHADALRAEYVALKVRHRSPYSLTAVAVAAKRGGAR